MGFGNKLKEVLKSKGMTIKELSSMTGISLNTLYSITKRDTHMPDKDTIDKITAALNISPNELISYEDFEKKFDAAVNQLQDTEIYMRKKLYEITEMLNVDAMYELINTAIEMLQDDSYRSFFYKKKS
ncbi:MAG: helix-turn-helix transcriptional regulator [Lachnospiraceae bacterium]|nr:helix-turn-helix transcriptional regulator [Lachnospiraceae bacterium]